MFFEKELISLNLLDVLELKQKNVKMWNTARNFSALSFRRKSDTNLITKTNEYIVKDNCVTYVPARLDYCRSSSVDELIVVHFETTNYQTGNIETFMPRKPEAIEFLFNEILNVWNKKELGYKYKCTALLYEIFAECYKQSFKQERKNTKIENSVEYILKNYTQHGLSISEVAKVSFMSEVYFRKLFKEEYGISPRKYITNLRIQNAAGLISTGYYSLTEVAYMSGYNDYKYFSVEFKKVMGISPSKYLYNYGK